MHVNIAGLIADRFESGFSRADFQICVRNKAVLRAVEADGHGRRVTIPQFEIDVAQAAVKREFAGVGNGLSRCRAFVGVPKHVVMRAALEIARVRRQNEHRAMRAITDEANSGPNVDGMLDAVMSFGNEEDAMVCRFLKVIDSGLKRGTLVRFRIGYAYVNSLRVIGTKFEHRLRSCDLAT